MLLYNKRVLKFFRKDGHQWKRKKDGRAIAEAHERLKASYILVSLDVNLIMVKIIDVDMFFKVANEVCL